jgi:hypothetical protein
MCGRGCAGRGEDMDMHPQSLCVHPQCLCMCTLEQAWNACAREVCKCAAHIDTCTCKETCVQPAAPWTSAGQLGWAPGIGSVPTPDPPGEVCPTHTKPTLSCSHCGDFAPDGGRGPKGLPGKAYCEPQCPSPNAPRLSPAGDLRLQMVGGEGEEHCCLVSFPALGRGAALGLPCPPRPPLMPTPPFISFESDPPPPRNRKI